MRLRILTGLAAFGLIVGGCASPGTPRVHHASDVITQQEIDAYAGDDVYLLIQSLHGNWLRERGQTSMSLSAPVMVYFDGMPQPEGIGALKNLRPQQVEKITYLDSREATSRFGTGHANGAILVTLR